MVSYFHDIYVPILPMGLSYQATFYCIWIRFEAFLQFQSSQMSKTIDFSLNSLEKNSIMEARDKMALLIKIVFLMFYDSNM